MISLHTSTDITLHSKSTLEKNRAYTHSPLTINPCEPRASPSPPSLLRTRPARTPPFACHETRAPLSLAAQRTSPLRLPTPQPPTQYTFASRLSHIDTDPATSLLRASHSSWCRPGVAPSSVLRRLRPCTWVTESECSLFSPNERNYLALSAPGSARTSRLSVRESCLECDIKAVRSPVRSPPAPPIMHMCGRLLPLRGKALPASAAPRPWRGCLAGVRTRRAPSRPKPVARARQRGARSALLGGNAPLKSLYSIRPGEQGEYTIVRALYFNSHSLAGLLNRRVGGRKGELNGDLLQRRGLSLLAYSTCCKLFGSTGNCFCGAVYHCHANATAEGSGEQQRGNDLRRQPLDPSERPPCISAEQWSRCIHLNAPQSQLHSRAAEERDMDRPGCAVGREAVGAHAQCRQGHLPEEPVDACVSLGPLAVKCEVEMEPLEETAGTQDEGTGRDGYRLQRQLPFAESIFEAGSSVAGSACGLYVGEDRTPAIHRPAVTGSSKRNAERPASHCAVHKSASAPKKRPQTHAHRRSGRGRTIISYHSGSGGGAGGDGAADNLSAGHPPQVPLVRVQLRVPAE
eukprot:scaffold13930_cov65-Phaeocystis_antarctica.AAC.5